MFIHIHELIAGKLDRVCKYRFTVDHTEHAGFIQPHIGRDFFGLADRQILSVADIFGLARNTGHSKSGNDHIHPAVCFKGIHDILQEIGLVDIGIGFIPLCQIHHHTLGDIIVDRHGFAHDQDIRNIAGHDIGIHPGKTCGAVIIIFRKIILAVILDGYSIVGILLVELDDLTADII